MLRAVVGLVTRGHGSGRQKMLAQIELDRRGGYAGLPAEIGNTHRTSPQRPPHRQRRLAVLPGAPPLSTANAPGPAPSRPSGRREFAVLTLPTPVTFGSR